MTNPRNKSETLSETTKTYLKQIFIEEKYGRKKEITNKYLTKGLLMEEDSLSLASEHYGKLLVKNKETLENSFVKGTPDIKMGDAGILDIKTSWNIFTFADADGTDKDYYWQLQGYMYLTNRTEADLAYCLVNAPEHLIVQEKSRRMYQLGLTDDMHEAIEEMENEVEKEMKFDDIPAAERIKVYHFEFDPKGFIALEERVKAARSYLNTLSL